LAKITLEYIRHSYLPDPKRDEDYALQRINVEWRDGGAYALLGPSGCGKTTLLNLISGLRTPTEGKILYDGDDVTTLQPDQRNIAQVFQFPVIYDTMSVYDNLAFPLRNRGIAGPLAEARVMEIAEMLEITGMLKRKAAGLSPDNKQKLSMGRGLVREDVNAVLFDEPLTVIDPHLKWKLRSKLKELHQKIKHTMIYVTHDQTEALTFADEVVVMDAGEIVQIGTPVELFERPAHTFVGHFIGSPGMNVLPCEVRGEGIRFQGHNLQTDGEIDRAKSGTSELGIRPEFVSLAQTGIEARVRKVSDVGRHAVVDALVGEHNIAAMHEGEMPNQGDLIHLAFKPEHTRLYVDGWLAMKETRE